MASVEVGYPLSSLRGTKELVHGVRCAFLGKTIVSLVLSHRLNNSFLFSCMVCLRPAKKTSSRYQPEQYHSRQEKQEMAYWFAHRLGAEQ